MEWILPFDTPEVSLAEAGGKGINLSRMARAGFPVPPGFIISTATYRRFVADNDLQPRILAALHKADPAQPSTLERASDHIHALFIAGHIPPAIATEIETAYLSLNPKSKIHNLKFPVAVRSSATAEDLPDASFAGQQETFLNVQGADAVLDAVKRCWASLWTGRAIAYRLRQGIPPDAVSLAVVVQQMVDADAAGILFTANPMTGTRNEVVINAAWGLGEAIVGGLVTPDDVVADKESGAIKRQTVADKAVMTVQVASGTEEHPVDAARRHAPVLNAAQIARLVALARDIEAYYGAPQDIEWCLAGGEFFIVQARPITALPATLEASPPLRWEPPTDGLWLHGGGSLELLTEPVSPLGASMMLPVMEEEFVAWMARSGIADVFDRPFLAPVNGYMYVNLRLHLRPKHLWYWAKFFQEHMQSMDGWVDALREYRETVADATGKPIGGLSAAALCDRAEALTRAGLIYWVYMTKIVQPIFRLEQRFIKFYERAVRREDDPEPEVFLRGQETRPLAAERSVYILAELAQTLPGVPNLLAADDPLAACATTEDGQRFLNALDAHLAKFGHQIYSFDPQLPTLADDPLPVVMAVLAHVQGKASPDARVAAMRRERETALSGIEARLGRRTLRRFHKLLSVAQGAARMREDALFAVGIAWTPLYRTLRELGVRLVAAGALESAEGVFWLHWDEIRATAGRLDSGEVPASLVAQAQARQETQKAWQRARPPYILPEDAKPKFWWKLAFPVPELQEHEDGALVGLGVSPGSVTGVARVVASTSEMDRVGQGEILVAHATTPAWTPLFARISALVTDMGGALAHGSIVAREYGIPAVMGTGSATQRILDGQTITVDGAAGRVYLM